MQGFDRPLTLGAVSQSRPGYLDGLRGAVVYFSRTTGVTGVVSLVIASGCIRF